LLQNKKNKRQSKFFKSNINNKKKIDFLKDLPFSGIISRKYRLVGYYLNGSEG
jgi:hypothetical protein